MSYDENWIKPDHNAYDRRLEPLPELDSDEVYIERRKASERQLFMAQNYIRDEVIPDCLTDEFIESFSFFLAEGDAEAGLDALNELSKACRLKVAEQARKDVDNE